MQRLHRKFGHPLVRRLQDVLERASYNVDKDALEYLTKYCKHCQKHGQLPKRFKFSLKDDVDFNYCIIIDVFYITGKLVLYVIDEGTRYQAGKWLQNISAKHTVGGRTLARRKPYKNDTRKPSNKTRRRTHM